MCSLVLFSLKLIFLYSLVLLGGLKVVFEYSLVVALLGLKVMFVQSCTVWWCEGGICVQRCAAVSPDTALRLKAQTD